MRAAIDRYAMFQSTPPARGATGISRTREDSLGFQSTPPARGATCAFVTGATMISFQSTPPARGATARKAS